MLHITKYRRISNGNYKLGQFKLDFKYEEYQKLKVIFINPETTKEIICTQQYKRYTKPMKPFCPKYLVRGVL